jgi:SAM-dependent methyltransferase
MLPDYQRDPVSAAKYSDYRNWLLLNIYRAACLQLHAGPRLHILDIGCGPGFFIAVNRALEHECDGVDVPEQYFTSVERKVYAELLAAFGCARYRSSLLIERFVPLPFQTQFDLITAFWICFNRHRQPDEWGVEEWRFFVEDARRLLRERGRLYLELNEHAERYGTLRFYDAETLEYFRSVGDVDRGRITIVQT